MLSLSKAIDEISTLSTESKNAFLNAWKEWNVPKDYFLVRENAIADYIFFIEKELPEFIIIRMKKK